MMEINIILNIMFNKRENEEIISVKIIIKFQKIIVIIKLKKKIIKII